MYVISTYLENYKLNTDNIYTIGIIMTTMRPIWFSHNLLVTYKVFS